MRHPQRRSPAKSLRVPITLLLVFVIFWAALALHPISRGDWWLENALTLVSGPIFVVTRNRMRFSNLAYLSIFVFFCFHSIGAHYTYSLVPYDNVWSTLTGHTLNSVFGWTRNHYDRLVHFLYGALMLVPSLELFVVHAPPKRIWRVLMPIFFIMGHSVIYELIEWAAASVVAPELGQAYLGTQGDEWDSQKDMGLATLGAVTTMLILRWSPAWEHRFAV